MRSAWGRFPELHDLPADTRKAALQYAFGQVSSRPVFYVSMLPLAAAVAAMSGVGEATVGGWGGRLAGIVVGALVGAFASDRPMQGAMRPDLRRFLDGPAAH